MSVDNKILNYLKQLEREKSWFNRMLPYGGSLGVYESVSGFYLYFVKQMNQIEMFFLLAHNFLGFLFLCFPIVFLSQHLKYKKITAGPIFNLTGVLIFIASIVSSLSGAYLIFEGVSGHQTVWLIHVYSSVFWVCFIVIYIGILLSHIYKISFSAEQYVKNKIQRTLKIAATVSGIFAFSLVLAGIYYSNIKWFEDLSKDYSLPFPTKNIFYPAVIRVGDNNRPVNPKALEGSRSCGTTDCHSEIYKQWNQSSHKNTLNPFFVTVMRDYVQEIKSSELFYGKIGPHIQKIKQNSQKTEIESQRRCMGCHNPIPLLAGRITPGKISLDKHSPEEGISCITCHAISKRIKSNKLFLEKFEISEPQRYLFANSENRIGQFLYKTLIKTKPESHRKTFTRELYKDSDYCISCHRGNSHYAAWKRSSYSLTKSISNQENTKTCIDCHMPQISTSNDVSATEKGTIADHRYLGIGTALAKYYGLKDQFDATEAYLKKDKVKIKIIAPKIMGLSNKLTIYLRVANVGVGHFFPGSPEGLIEAWPALRLTDSKGREVFTYGQLDKNGYLNNKTKIFRGVAFDRNGRELSAARHETWKITTRKILNILPHEYVEFPININFKSPPRQDSIIRIEAKLKFREPNQQFADWVFGKGQFEVPVTDMAEDRFDIKISANKKEVIDSIKEWTHRLGSEGFEFYKKGVSDFMTVEGEDNEDRAIKIILREIALLIESKRFSEALELIKELKVMHPMKSLIDKKTEPLEKLIREKLKS